jgi:hypothetical protein
MPHLSLLGKAIFFFTSFELMHVYDLRECQTEADKDSFILKQLILLYIVYVTFYSVKVFTV